MHCRGSWLAGFLLLSALFSGSALRTFDDLQHVKKHARRTTDEQFRSSIVVSTGILRQHNSMRDSQPLQQYINHLEQLLQRDCCDYFTALPLVEGLTDNLKKVLDRQLPQELQPPLRRSYVSAIWLLQRSRQFRWDTNTLHKQALSGFTRLFEAHLDASVGRPISFHHISKSGGTSMCQLARVNGCQGPLMTRADNCLLDKGMDGPVWVMKHDALIDNGIPEPPPPPPPPRRPPPPPPLSVIFGDDPDDDDADTAADKASGSRRAGKRHNSNFARSVNDDGDSRWGDDDDDGDDDQPSWNHPGAPDENPFLDPAAKAVGTLPPMPVEAMQWFMYDCNSMPKDKEGYGCSDRQEAATAKSATFFANEHTLSMQQGEPQVCSAFTNLVMVREPLSEAVSLMSEVIQVYDRLLRRLSIQAWSLPRSDLSWWQRWAPVVVGSYATRTLLGPTAFCPPKEQLGAVAAGAAQWPQRVMNASGGMERVSAEYADPALKPGEAWLFLSGDQLSSALERLYAFDVVLELGSPELIDISTSALLGWKQESFSKQQPQRGVVAARALTWQELQQLATQTPPATIWLMPKPAAAAAAAGEMTGQLPHNSTSRSIPQQKDGHGMLDADVAKRMLAEAWVRRALADVGVQYVITPLLPGHKLEQKPPLRAIAVAETALQRVNKTSVTVFSNSTAGGHVVVKVEVRPEAAVVRYTIHTAGGHAAAAAGSRGAASDPDNIAAAGSAAVKAAGADTAAATVEFYHVWPKHGVVLDEQQYHKLLKMTAADQQLHEHAELLQLLDAAWLTVVSKTRGYSKFVGALQAGRDVGTSSGCGFAGLNHML